MDKALTKPFEFAKRKHENQRRKDEGGTPYFEHPKKVFEILMEAGVDDSAVLTAALLHDTLEDTDTTLEELSAEFGERVAAIVQEVTDDETVPKDVRKESQIRTACELSPEAALVRVADKIANLHDIIYNPPASWNIERRLAYIDWAEAVVRSCPTVNEQLRGIFAEKVEEGRRLLRSWCV